MVDGGKAISLELPQPTKRVGFYKDFAVVAYPALETEIIDAQTMPVVTASNPGLDIGIVTNGRRDQESNFYKKKLLRESWKIGFDTR